MKYLICIITIFAFFSCRNDLVNNSLEKDANKEKIEFFNKIFTSDSGYIIKRNKFDYLLLNFELFGVLDWDTMNFSKDTIGKYYKDKNNMVFGCTTEDYTEITLNSHFLFNLDLAKAKFQCERFIDGMQQSCWKNSYDGFKKIGNYYFYRSCPTPIGQYAESIIYIFNKQIPFEGQNGIYEFLWSLGLKSVYDLNSEIEIKNDSLLVMHYIEKVGQIDTDSIRKGVIIIKSERTKKFNVEYKLIGKKWYPEDSSYIKKFGNF